MSWFDRARQVANKVVTNVYADSAIWEPLAGGSFTADVLFSEPTQDEKIGDQDYTALRPRIEYLEGVFTGLLESVLSGNGEVLSIKGQQYTGMGGEKKYDGKTVIIYLDPLP